MNFYEGGVYISISYKASYRLLTTLKSWGECRKTSICVLQKKGVYIGIISIYVESNKMSSLMFEYLLLQ